MANNKSKKFTIAALILLPLLIVCVFLIANFMFSDSSLSKLHKDKLGLSEKDISRSIGDKSDDPFSDGMKALEANDYPAAIAFFKSVPADSESYTQARLYLAYAHFENNDFEKAIENSQIVIEKSENIINRQAAEWLQLQSMLSQGDADDATFDLLLDKIASNEQHLLNAEANELDKSMNSFWRGLVF